MLLYSLILGVVMTANQTAQEQLDLLLNQSTRVVVLSDATPRVLFDSSKREDLLALRAALRLNPDSSRARCLCVGDAPIHLYAGQRKLGEITNQHGAAVRFTGGGYDAQLVDPKLWLAWYDTRGVHGPSQEWAESERRAKESAEHQRRWREATPASLRGKTTDLRAALAGEGDEQAQIRALLRWYAAGAGPWSGYPSYESEVEALLLTFKTSALVAAVDSAVDASELDGAARLFSGWDFGQQRPADRKALPKALKLRLLERALTSSIEDNRVRARTALGR